MSIVFRYLCLEILIKRVWTLTLKLLSLSQRSFVLRAKFRDVHLVVLCYKRTFLTYLCLCLAIMLLMDSCGANPLLITRYCICVALTTVCILFWLISDSILGCYCDS